MIFNSAAGVGQPTDPTVLMRSHLTVKGALRRFPFLFMLRLRSVEQLLGRLGVGVWPATA